MGESAFSPHAHIFATSIAPDMWVTANIKQFNLNVPEVDLHKSDLHVYRSVSAYPPSPPTPGSDPCNVPPLLVAFILDTSDLKNGQALMWNREGGKVSIDTSLLGKGKGKEKERKTGIVLERWTFRAKSVPTL